MVKYVCYRCDYETKDKNNMRRHLYNLNKKCKAKSLKQDIELTETIKEKILENGVYYKPIEVKKKVEVNSNAPRGYYIIYLLRPKILRDRNINIFKIGVSYVKDSDRTINRVLSYGTGVELVSLSQCKNGKLIEDLIKKEFKINFKLEQGSEYFSGDVIHMKRIISDIINNEETECEEEVIETRYTKKENVKEIISTMEELSNGV